MPRSFDTKIEKDMAWHQILGHERIKKILQKTIADKRIPGAYCFHGLDGIGKDALALEFSKVVNCQSPNVTDNEIEACGKCSACRMAKEFKHPNIIFVHSLPTPKTPKSKADSPLAGMSNEQVDKIREELDEKSKDPYHKINIPNASQIKIGQIRHLKNSLAMTSPMKGRRVVIISNADEMTTEAANAFLKTLEEPHENITIILTTSKVSAIPITIMSRCQQVRCEPIQDEIISEILVSRHGVSTEEAAIISAFSQGSYNAARDFMDEGMQEKRTDIVNMLRTSVKKKYRLELCEFIDKITALKNKRETETYLRLLHFWLRDAAILARTGTADGLINFDQHETIAKFIGYFKGRDFEAAVWEVEKTIGTMSRNITPGLMLLGLFLKLRHIFIGKS